MGVKVECPDGTIVETGSQVALNYYQCEPGYRILGDEPPTVVEDGVEVLAGPPAKSATKAEWFEYAQGLGLDVPADEADITRDELIALVEAANQE